MATVIDIFVWIFAAFGLVFLTGVILYYIAKQIKKYKPPEQPIWPDASYMEKIGAEVAIQKKKNQLLLAPQILAEAHQI